MCTTHMDATQSEVMEQAEGHATAGSGALEEGLKTHGGVFRRACGNEGSESRPQAGDRECREGVGAKAYTQSPGFTISICKGEMGYTCPHQDRGVRPHQQRNNHFGPPRLQSGVCGGGRSKQGERGSHRQ